jgi:glycosyltransferase involved in cell wall biosynthesis
MKTIYFYSPSPISQEILNTPPNESFSFSSNFSCWVLRTYLHLKTVYHCELVNEIPAQGIVLADRDSLGNVYPYLDSVMLICAKGDREFHPSAHLHIVHNPYDFENHQNSIWNPDYISHWPQPGLISRDSNRGSKIENVAFIGTASQLAEELKSNPWIEALNDLDCKWLPIFNKDKWNDCTNIDVIIAARSFDGKSYHNKPASKLINCWWAGVPAILTPESSFMACRKSELDFLIIESTEDAINAIKKLKHNPNLYLDMIQNGLERAQEFSPEIVKQQWIDFFDNFAFPAYDKWQSLSPFQKRIDYLRRYLKLKSNRVLNRF